MTRVAPSLESIASQAASSSQSRRARSREDDDKSLSRRRDGDLHPLRETRSFSFFFTRGAGVVSTACIVSRESPMGLTGFHLADPRSSRGREDWTPLTKNCKIQTWV